VVSLFIPNAKWEIIEIRRSSVFVELEYDSIDDSPASRGNLVKTAVLELGFLDEKFYWLTEYPELWTYWKPENITTRFNMAKRLLKLGCSVEAINLLTSCERSELGEEGRKILAEGYFMKALTEKDRRIHSSSSWDKIGTWRYYIANAIALDSSLRKRWVEELSQNLKDYQSGQKTEPELFLELSSELQGFSEGYPELEECAKETLENFTNSFLDGLINGNRWEIYELILLKELLPENKVTANKIQKIVEPNVEAEKISIMNGSTYSFRVLGDYGELADSSTPWLVEFILDNDSYRRRDGIKALGRIKGNPSLALPVLIKFLKDGDWKERRLTVEALANYGTAAQSTIPDLVEALQDEDDGVRELATYAIGEIGGKDAQEAIPFFLDSLNHADDQVDLCYNAILTLGKLGARQAEPELLELLNHDSKQIRFASAFSLVLSI